MKKITLAVEKRTILGRKVKQLRKKHLVPGNIFGKQVASVAVAVGEDQFQTVYKEAGETGVVEILLEGEKRPVLIHHVQRDPVKGATLHVDFYQVDLTQKVNANVPIELVGEAAAVKDKVGILLSLLDEVEVEALPTEIPEKITIDVTNLSSIDQVIKVGDVAPIPGMVMVTPLEAEIVKVGELVSREAEELVQQEAAAAAAAEAEAQARQEETGVKGAGAATGEPAAKKEEVKPPEEEKK